MCLCDVKHIRTIPIKTITLVLKVLTYIIPSISTHPIGLAVILTIMSVSTFTTAVILYVLLNVVIWYILYLWGTCRHEKITFGKTISLKLDVCCIVFFGCDKLTSNDIAWSHVRVQIFNWPINEEPTTIKNENMPRNWTSHPFYAWGRQIKHLFLLSTFPNL